MNSIYSVGVSYYMILSISHIDRLSWHHGGVIFGFFLFWVYPFHVKESIPWSQSNRKESEAMQSKATQRDTKQRNADRKEAEQSNSSQSDATQSNAKEIIAKHNNTVQSKAKQS